MSDARSTTQPVAWLLTRHGHADYDETFHFDWDDVNEAAAFDSEDLPEGEFHHKPRPLYSEDALAALRKRCEDAERERDTLKILAETAGESVRATQDAFAERDHLRTDRDRLREALKGIRNLPGDFTAPDIYWRESREIARKALEASDG